MEGDLHTQKDSHFATPADAKVELHLAHKDLNKDVKMDQVYTICIPMVCTSTDGDSSRFRQIAKPYVESGPVFDKPKKDRQEKTRHGAEVTRYNASG